MLEVPEDSANVVPSKHDAARSTPADPQDRDNSRDLEELEGIGLVHPDTHLELSKVIQVFANNTAHATGDVGTAIRDWANRTLKIGLAEAATKFAALIRPVVPDQQTSSSTELSPRIRIDNPSHIGIPVAFTYQGEVQRLAPGDVFEQTISKSEDAPIIRFDRGGDFGSTEIEADPQSYTFQVDKSGWRLVPNSAANL